MSEQVTKETRVFPHDLMRQGGTHLREARSYVQRAANNGETVIWGSEEPVTLSMRQIEEMAAYIAAAVINEVRS